MAKVPVNRDPFSVWAGLELREDEEGTPFGVPSGFDAWVWARVVVRERQRVAAELFRGCGCQQCRADTADLTAGRRVVTRVRGGMRRV